jgi:uncharacterized protein YkwD
MKSRHGLLALAMCAAAVAASAQTAADAQLLASAQKFRARGCRGHAGTDAPLRWSAALARGAARIENGENTMKALEAEGYRATRVFRSSFVGYRTPVDVAKALAQQFCGDLVEPHFTDIGMSRKGREWMVVLAERFQLPRLADKRKAVERVLALVNEARAHPRQCGDRAFEAATPLRWDDRLEHAAAEHAHDMASHTKLDHAGSDGSTPAQRVARSGYSWRNVGENVAAGQRTAEEVVDDWLSSPGHCANIMEPEYREMGAAFDINMKSTAAVYWAQEFGRERE